MDNQIYERDYTSKKGASDAQERKALLDYSISSGVLKTMSESFNQLPRETNNEKKAAYERILAALDTIANILGGQIKGIVDCQNWEAHIYAYLPFAEFSSLEELELLKDIAENAQTVTFTATPNGGIRLNILIAYFDVIGDVEDTLAEDIAQCPELVALLDKSQHAERNKLMNDPRFAQLIKDGASNTGLGVEEYADYLIRLLQNHPEELTDQIRFWINNY